MVGLGITGNIIGSDGGSVGNPGISCMVTDRETGQQSEMPVFQGHQISDKNLPNNSQIACMVKLIKTTTSELASIQYPQIDGLVIANDGSDKESKRIFDNIRMSVATCGSPSRYYNRCYMSGRDYKDKDSDLLTGRAFTGARAIYGERFYLVSLQYSKSLEHLFPVADAYFNLMNKLVPLQIAAPRLRELTVDRNYLKCRVRRTNGRVHTGFIHISAYSMVIYQSASGYSINGGLTPYITVNFNSDGSDVLDVVSDKSDTSGTSMNSNDINNQVTFPAHDAYKTIRVADFLAENPAFSECFLSDLNFERLTLKMLYNLCKHEQQ
jgi:hypothetical protein